VDFVYHPESEILGNTIFLLLDPFQSSSKGRETLALLGPLESANLNHLTTDWGYLFLRDQQSKRLASPRLKTETDPVSETLFSRI
jgi:hypothetical protein